MYRGKRLINWSTGGRPQEAAAANSTGYKSMDAPEAPDQASTQEAQPLSHVVRHLETSRDTVGIRCLEVDPVTGRRPLPALLEWSFSLTEAHGEVVLPVAIEEDSQSSGCSRKWRESVTGEVQACKFMVFTISSAAILSSWVPLSARHGCDFAQ